MDWSKYVALLPYGNRWKEHRRMMHTWLQKNATRSFHASQQQQTRMLLARLLTSTSPLNDELYRYAWFFLHLGAIDASVYVRVRTVAATLLRSVYGYELDRVDDPFVAGAKEAIDNLARAAMSTSK